MSEWVSALWAVVSNITNCSRTPIWRAWTAGTRARVRQVTAPTSLTCGQGNRQSAAIIALSYAHIIANMHELPLCWGFAQPCITFNCVLRGCKWSEKIAAKFCTSVQPVIIFCFFSLFIWEFIGTIKLMKFTSRIGPRKSKMRDPEIFAKPDCDFWIATLKLRTLFFGVTLPTVCSRFISCHFEASNCSQA